MSSTIELDHLTSKAKRFLAVDESYIDEGTLRVDSPRRIHIHKGDVLVTFRRRGTDVLFTGLYLVTSRRLDELESGEYSLEATLGEGGDFEEPRSLDEYRFSLPRVYNEREPHRHFTRQYTRVSGSDVGVLVHERIFWARTALGILAAALPPTALMSVVSRILAREPSAARDLGAAWQEFSDLLIGEYIVPAQLVVSTAENFGIFDEMRDDPEAPAANELRLTMPDGTGAFRPSLYTAPAEALLHDFSDGEHGPLLERLSAMVALTRDQDAALAEAFEGRLWPLRVLT